MRKSYCRQCVWHKNEGYHGSQSRCTHHDNTEVKDTWYEPKEEYKRNPDSINKENSCSWFKPIGF